MYETRSNRVGCFAKSDFHAEHQNGQFLTSQAGLVWSSLASLKLCCWVCPNEGRLFWDYGKVYCKCPVLQQKKRVQTWPNGTTFTPVSSRAPHLTSLMLCCYPVSDVCDSSSVCQGLLGEGLQLLLSVILPISEKATPTSSMCYFQSKF